MGGCVLAAALATAATAGAAPGDTYACHWQGTITLNPGTYTLTGSGLCAKGDADPGQTTNSGSYAFTLSSSGAVSGDPCLIGSLTGPETMSSTTPGFEGVVSATGSANLIAGYGPVTLSSISNSQRSGGSGAGYMWISPCNASGSSPVSGAFDATV